MTDFPIRMEESEKRLLGECLEKSYYYLEYGCGGSTVLACQSPAKIIVSIESDAQWIAKLRENQDFKQAAAQGRLILHHVDIGEVGLWGKPKNDTKIRQWPKYYLWPYLAHEYPYDLILIDGRFRVECALAAAALGSPETKIAIHDYERRPVYYDVEKFFDPVASAGTLFVFRRRQTLNYRALFIDFASNQFNLE
jgi:hypothetical protein